MCILKKGVLVMMICFLIGSVNVNTADGATDVRAKRGMIIEGG
ncbi:hypothetical protein [Bacillus subtilis]|nr:hypothetical protein [Bacillus subtilis]